MASPFPTVRRGSPLDDDSKKSGFLGTLTRHEKLALFVCLGSSAIAWLLPFEATKILLGAILAAVWVYLSFQELYLGIALLVFFLPLQHLMPSDSLLMPGINVQTIFTFFFLFLWAYYEVARDRPAPRKANPLVLPLLGLLAVVVFSAVHSAWASYYTLGELFSRIKNWFAYAFLAFVTYRHVVGGREKRFILLFLFLSVFLNVLVSLGNVVEAHLAGLDLARHRAVSLIAPQPNLYAGFLALYLFFFLSFLAYYPMKLSRKLLFAAVTGLVFVNFLYTLSRGAWLAFLVAGLLLALVKSRRLVIPLAAILMIGFFFAPAVVEERIQTTFKEEYDPGHLLGQQAQPIGEVALRYTQWKTFPSLLAENPAIGVGYGRYPERLYERGFHYEPRSAHSTIIEIGVEEGLLGLVLYFWILLAMGWRSWRISRNPPNRLALVLAVGLLGATLCLLLLDLSGTRFRYSFVTAYLWILAGMSLNATQNLENDSAPLAAGREKYGQRIARI